MSSVRSSTTLSPRLKAGAESLKLGRPEDPATGMGPLVSAGASPRKCCPITRRRVEQGATVVTGGGVPDMPRDLREGAWVQPTIWTGLSDDAVVVTEEIFGPCCHIRPFDIGRGGDPARQRHALWPGGGGLDGEPVARAIASRRKWTLASAG